MSPKNRQTDNVFSLFDDDDLPEEVPVGYQILPQVAPPPPAGQVIDLTDKPKAVLAIANGGAGKTTLLRWVAERALSAGREVKIAATDPSGRSLLNFFPGGPAAGVFEPPTRKSDEVADWMEKFFGALVKEQKSGLIDTGGGDTAFTKVISDMPRLVDDLAEEGIATVVVYMFAPRADDVGPLATLSRAGFTPAATALVLNEGVIKVGDGGDVEQAFRETRRHSVYRAAIERGAIELRMPALQIAKKIESRSQQFRHARDGIVPDGKKLVPLGWSDKTILRSWLTRMDERFAPIASWWP
jgi:hypothetical protein